MLFPFLVVEWKSCASGGTQYNAQNQVAQSGTALVYTIEQLRGLASSGLDVPPSQSDDPLAKQNSKSQSAIFSNTLDSESAYLWVHWCQTDDTAGTKSYHMSLVKKYWLDEADDVWALRQMIDNIVDWGLGKRLEMIKSLLKAVELPIF
jgi:hypothetical protein